MCFLYRQSISIVYESKFKYIYRYFIKIDRCFCEILQSLPLRKCGLKLRGMECRYDEALSLPLRKCGLKLSWLLQMVQDLFVTSLAEVWIEILVIQIQNIYLTVTSLAEVWIEMLSLHPCSHLLQCHFPCGSVD